MIVDGVEWIGCGPAGGKYADEIVALQQVLQEHTDEAGWKVFLTGQVIKTIWAQFYASPPTAFAVGVMGG